MKPAADSDLHVESTGAGDPAIVLLHAGIADCRMWDREAVALSGRHHVVRYDMRGFGRSPDPDADYSDHADLLSVMTAMDIERAVLVGASNGGRVVLNSAVTAPDRVVGLVLIGSALPGRPVAPSLAAEFDDEETALREDDIDRAREINLRLWVDGVGRDRGEVSSTVRRTVGVWLDALLPRQAAQLRTPAGDAQPVEPPVADRLGEIAAPTLIMVGQHDQPSVRVAAQHLAFGIPHTRLVVVEGAAHLVNLEQPQRFDAALEAFLEELRGTPGTSS